MFSPRKWARPRTAHVCDQARTRTVREQATPTSANYLQTIRSRAEVVRVNRVWIVGRRSPRQTIARPVTLLRSKLTRHPALGVLLLGFRARRISFARYRGEPEVSPPSFSRDPVTKDNVSNGILFD